jgi:cobalt-zinc-cadmium efflux system membrane fusion protein
MSPSCRREFPASSGVRTTVERLRSAGPALAERLLREAEADYRQARIQVRNLIQTLVNLGLPVSLEELQSLDDERRARKLQFLGLPDAIVATLDPAKTTDNLLPLIAPFDGVVIGREITLGETVSPNDSHFVIADVSRMWVTLEVRKEDASAVRMGQEVQFQADGVAGKITGAVDWISTSVNEQSRTLQVRAEVSNPLVTTAGGTEAQVGDSEALQTGRQQRLLRANTFGTGTIVTRHDPVALVVPNDAVHFDGSEHFVFVLEHGQFHRQPIVPGVVVGQVTEVRDGLQDGATVVAAGSHLVKSEMSLAAARP